MQFSFPIPRRQSSFHSISRLTAHVVPKWLPMEILTNATLLNFGDYTTTVVSYRRSSIKRACLQAAFIVSVADRTRLQLSHILRNARAKDSFFSTSTSWHLKITLTNSTVTKDKQNDNPILLQLFVLLVSGLRLSGCEMK